MVSEFAMMNCGITEKGLNYLRNLNRLKTLSDRTWQKILFKFPNYQNWNWNLDVDDKQQYSSARKVQSQRKLIKLEQN